MRKKKINIFKNNSKDILIMKRLEDKLLFSLTVHFKSIFYVSKTTHNVIITSVYNLIENNINNYYINKN